MPEPTKWLALARYFGANVLFGAGIFFHAFLYNFYLDALGLSEAVMGAAQAALTAGSVLALLPAGRMVDRIGARRTLFVSAIVNAAGLIVSALAARPGTVYAASLLAGLGVGAWRVCLAPLLMQLTVGRVRSRAFSWNVGLLVGSGGIWIALAGAAPAWLTDVIGLSQLGAIRVALLVGVAGTVLSIPLYLLIRPDVDVTQASGEAIDRGSHSDSAAPSVPPLPLRHVVVLVGFVALWMTGPALVAPFFNIFFARRFAMPIEQVGLIFAVAHGVTALVIFWSGELAARFGPHRVLGMWTLLFGPVLLGLAGGQVLALAVALYLVQGIVPPATNPLIDQILLERAAPDRRGTVSSLRNVATEGSAIWGAAVGGVMLNASSFPVLFATAGGLGMMAAVSLILALRRSRAR